MSIQKVAFAAIFIAGGVVGTIPLFMRDQPVSSASTTQRSPAAAAVNSGSSSPVLGGTLGTYAGVELQRSELTSEEVFKLYEAEKQVHDAVQEILMQRYVTAFFENLKDEKGYASVDEAQDKYLSERAEVTDREVNSFLDENKGNANLMRIPEEERSSQVRRFLENQRKGEVIRGIASQGRQSNQIVSAIPAPKEPRVDVSIDDDAIMGPKDAPVTIVEFADYQCPFCARMVPTLKQALRKYPGKVRWVYRDFPLMEIHPEALPAAVAANCAGHQGKYYEMHGLLFDNLRSLGSETYTKLANDLQLDAEKFAECQKDPAEQQEVLADMQDGQRLGVNGTPAYFINGRRISGGMDMNRLSEIIEEELEALN